MGSEGLTLQEKMVKIRSEIPALVKRSYSEDVDYDFTKIDDIYRYMTPALNKWKVNLEIEFEQPTKRDELGNPVFVQYLNACQMWLYEADLGLEWINAENSEDTYRVTIHAIGTHNVPEKAKGSAWTYNMKYYLQNKYCIDQGGEDPDMRSGGVSDGTEYGSYDGSQAYGGSAENYDNGEIDAASGEIFGNELGASGDDIENYDNGTQVFGNDEEGSSEDIGENDDVFNRTGINKKDNNYSSEGEGEHGRKENAASQNASAEESKGRNEGGKANGKANEKAGKNVERAANKRTEKQPPVSPLIQPENGTMVTLPESAKESHAAGMSIEAAQNMVCTFGIYNKKRLGDLAEMGEEGVEALRWFAYDFRGRDKKIKEAAMLLLQTLGAA